MTLEAHEKSKATWDDMAAGWERHRDFMWDTTKHVAEWLVTNVDPKPGDTILDLAGGPGDNGLLVTRAVGPAGKVIETDFAPQMVEVARRRAAEQNAGNMETRVLDAEHMDLPDDSVDGIICRWGFMLMIDPDAALRECRRVLKSGGRLALSVWGAPDRNPWVTMVGMTMMQLGRPPSGDPFGPGGMFSMADPEKIRSMLSAAGFEVLRVEEMPVEWHYASFEEGWAFMTEVAGALASAIKELSAEEIDQLREALKQNYASFTDESGMTIPGVTINVLAT